MSVRVTIWNEFQHERESAEVRSVYPDGIHAAIARGLEQCSEGSQSSPDVESDSEALAIRCATLEMPEHGLSEEVLAATNVLFWWGHRAHDQVDDAIVERVKRHVLEGMGFVALHSAHHSKPFKALLGTHCSLRWREAGERERLWNLAPGHVLTRGIGETIELERTEMYGERFDIPPPEELIFISWFAGGEVFRSGCTWTRGHGRIFYFRPGHETYPIYHHPQVLRVLRNACTWARATSRHPDSCPNVPVSPEAEADEERTP